MQATAGLPSRCLVPVFAAVLAVFALAVPARACDLCAIYTGTMMQQEKTGPWLGIAEQYIGVNAYMSREALNRLLQEGPAISGARLAVDAARERELYRELRAMPRVAGTVVRDNSIRQFNEMMQETMSSSPLWA